jgi:Fe-S oxidoreductase
MENTGNPWGQPPQARNDWMKGTSKQEPLAIPHISEAPDAEVLFWVGCAGAFDDRNKKVVYDFAKLMQIAGIRFAVLGPEESCTGDPARRAGAEYIFQMLAQQNIETLDGYGVRKIVTICPHCFNTLFNEYPQLGGRYEVVHHTEFLADLVKQGRLQPEKRVDETITYHDPCYLARHNDVWEGARWVIESIPGAQYQELHRHKHTTFCCGAGGSRMWMEERMGKKMNVERTDEALASASSCLATGCPFCNIMLSDGITERHADDDMRVRDVAQILLESIEFHPESAAGAKASNGNGNGNGSVAASDGAQNGGYPATEAPDEMSDAPEGYPKPD